MLEPEIVVRIRALSAAGWGSRRIADDVGASRRAVKRYLRGAEALKQERPRARALDDAGLGLARELFVGVAAGNAVVVHQELQRRGYEVSERTVQRALRGIRAEAVASSKATVRFETEPGEQMQVDFGEKRVVIATAGGLVTEEETFERLLASAHVVWLRAKPDEHMSRVMRQGDLRPMARNRDAKNDLVAILKAREVDHARAHAELDTSGKSVETALRDLAEIVEGLFARG